MLIAWAIAGLLLAIIGREDSLGAHGILVILVALGGIFGVISKYYSPEPSKTRLSPKPAQFTWSPNESAPHEHPLFSYDRHPAV